jgi:hypothetical protein
MRISTHAAGAFFRVPLLLDFYKAKGRQKSNAAHALAAIRWLERAALETGNRGFAHSLHFIRGWLPGYPETTGYILPTLLLALRRFSPESSASCFEACWNWLRSIQQDDGSFCDLSGTPQVFDTGQILIGANLLFRENLLDVADLSRRACAWLSAQQSEDGSFVARAYRGRPHSYYSRVGAALVEAGQLHDSRPSIDAGLRNLEWTLRQQESNGWFQQMSFADDPPFSHTIVYTLEGLLAGYRLTSETQMLHAVLACAEPLRDRIEASGGIIRSQYREDFIAVDQEVCVTGLCQWSALCYRLDRLGIPGFRAQAERSLAAAKQLQIESSFAAIDGSLPGSVPLSGRYMRYALPNWGVKFFLDALLEAEGGPVPLPVLT